MLPCPVRPGPARMVGGCCCSRVTGSAPHRTAPHRTTVALPLSIFMSKPTTGLPLMLARNLRKLVMRCNLKHPNAPMIRDLMRRVSRKNYRQEFPEFSVELDYNHPVSEKISFHLTFLNGQEREVKAVLNNSFGFGGTNASLVMQRLED